MTLPDTATVDDALAELHALGFDVALEDNPGADWVRLDDYATDQSTLEAGLRLAGARFDRPDPSSASGGWLVGDIAAAIAWPAATVMLTHHALLLSSGSDVYLPAAHAERRLAARITTPDGGGPASPDTVADSIIATLQPVVEAVHARTRRGRHALWGTVTDMVAAAFHRVGDHLGRSSQARELASAVIDSTSTLVGGANWHDIVWPGGTEHTRIRNICCLWYQAPRGDLCLTCPRITDTERVEMLHRRQPTA
jgi:hypothetical protein